MKSKLNYLYRAVYRDGSIYDQNIHDISVADPSKSCYHDLKLGQIKYFTLSDGMDSYTIDLDDGGISINGSNKIQLTQEQLTDFELVYFRRVTMQMSGSGDRSYQIKHILGYTASDNAGVRKMYNITIS